MSVRSNEIAVYVRVSVRILANDDHTDAYACMLVAIINEHITQHRAQSAAQ